MNLHWIRAIAAAAIVPLAASNVASRAVPVSPKDVEAPRSTAIFEQNVGQFDAGVRYAALSSRGHGVAITEHGGLRLAVRGAGERKDATARIDITPRGGHPSRVQSLESLSTKVHRFIGSDPAKWQRNIPTAGRVRVPQVYDGVDLEYYGTEREIEYDFIVAPHADPSVIALHVDGATVRRDQSGDLILETPAGDVRQRAPVAYQDIDGERRTVPVTYRVSGSEVGFDVGDYDRARPLVVDPILVVSTFYGTGFYEYGVAVSHGPDGLYVAGSVTRLTAAHEDAFVAKYSVDGRTLEFVTYYGGDRPEAPPMNATETPAAIAVDHDGVIYVAGNTGSENLPIAGSAVQTTLLSPLDGFLFRLSPDGSSLLLSTYLGSTGLDALVDMVLGEDIYIAGVAYTEFNGFPIPMASGPGPGWLVRLTREGTPIAARRVDSVPRAIAVGDDGAVIVAGVGGSATPGAFQTTPGDSFCFAGRNSRPCADGNVARFRPDLSLEWATFLREASPQTNYAQDVIDDVAIDHSGAVYVVGQTSSATFPVTPGAYQATCGFCGQIGTGNAFVTKLNATGSGLVFSTFLGGTREAYARSVAVDRSGDVFVTGFTRGSDFPAVGPQLPAAAPPADAPPNAFVTLLNAAGTSAIYSSRFGGSSGEMGYGLALSRFGTVTITGWTGSADFPVVDAVQPTLGGGLDAFVSIISVPRVVTRLESPIDGETTRAASVTLRGFAADTRAVGGAGIDGVHVYAYPSAGGPPTFLGLATYGESRPDVADALGDDFVATGFSLTTTLSPDEYLFVAYAHSSVTGEFGYPASARVRAVAGAQLDLQTPPPGDSNQSVTVSGTAVDLSAPTGTGIDTIHVWAYPNPGSGTAPRFLGVAEYGLERPELELAYGARFRNAGFSLETRLDPGPWLVVAYGHSTVSQTFSVYKTVAINVRAGQSEIHFETPTGPVVYSGFQINGWARDANALVGGGWDAVHVWAYPNPGSGTPPVFLGANTTPYGRLDIAATHGAQALMSGFALRTAPLPAGNYLVVLFARSTVTRQFDAQTSRLLEVREATEPVMQLDSPVNGATVGHLFGVSGYAFDPRAATGNGVDGIHVWLYPNWGSGAPPQFLGLAAYTWDSPQVGTSFGLNFSKTAFNMPVEVASGTHLIAVFAHSSVTGQFAVKTAFVTRP